MSHYLTPYMCYVWHAPYHVVSFFLSILTVTKQYTLNFEWHVISLNPSASLSASPQDRRRDLNQFIRQRRAGRKVSEITCHWQEFMHHINLSFQTFQHYFKQINLRIRFAAPHKTREDEFRARSVVDASVARLNKTYQLAASHN
eukprot:sb/3474003/